jgi:transposase
MPVLQCMVHPRSLDFRNQKKLMVMRDVREMEWKDIVPNLVNLQGDHPSESYVRKVYKDFNVKTGVRRNPKYAKCGRKPWKLTQDAKSHVLKTMLRLRGSSACTSTTLQRDLARVKKVKVSASAIRKFLISKGYHWLPRAQKRKYSPADRRARLAWAKQVNRMTVRALREKIALAMDGVVLTVPPRDPVDRHNFCMQGGTHMWRKKSEYAKPDLAGGDPYASQAPLSQSLPLWGGISANGFAVVTFHKYKKLNTSEWVALVRRGSVTNAIRSLRPAAPRGPWHVICDNEGFLGARLSQQAHRAAHVHPWHVPPRSPDLNPVEKYWAWLRRKLRAMDLEDLRKKKAPVTKAQLRIRVRNVCRTHAARKVAGACVAGLRKVCKEVIKKRGAMAKS